MTLIKLRNTKKNCNPWIHHMAPFLFHFDRQVRCYSGKEEWVPKLEFWWDFGGISKNKHCSCSKTLQKTIPCPEPSLGNLGWDLAALWPDIIQKNQAAVPSETRASPSSSLESKNEKQKIKLMWTDFLLFCLKVWFLMLSDVRFWHTVCESLLLRIVI